MIGIHVTKLCEIMDFFFRCEQQNDGSFKVRVYDCGDWAFDPNQGSCVWPGMDNDLCPEEY